jgi:ATP-dependent Clp protease ATP-binding subunit ClpC
VVTILGLELAKVRQRLASRGTEIVLAPAAQDFLIEKGYDPALGARPLRRAIQRHLEDPLAEELLRGTLGAAERVEVVRAEAGLAFQAAVPVS